MMTGHVSIYLVCLVTHVISADENGRRSSRSLLTARTTDKKSLVGQGEQFILSPCYSNCVTPQANAYALNQNQGAYANAMTNMLQHRKDAWTQATDNVNEFKAKVLIKEGISQSVFQNAASSMKLTMTEFDTMKTKLDTMSSYIAANVSEARQLFGRDESGSNGFEKEYMKPIQDARASAEQKINNFNTSI